MRGVACVLVLAGCGRVGFDAEGPRADATIAGSDPSGELDPGFGAGGYTIVGSGPGEGHAYDVVARPSGGYFTFGHDEASGTVAANLIGWTSSGQIDTTFGSQRYLDTQSSYGYSIARLPDGRLLLGGDGFSGPTQDDMVFFEVLPDGTLDPTYGADDSGFQILNLSSMGSNDTALKILATTTGAIACGISERQATDTHAAVIHLNSDGPIDRVFGPNGFDDVDTGEDVCTDAAIDGAGRLVTVGIGGQSLAVTRYTMMPDARDTTFANGGRFLRSATDTSEGLGVALDVDGDIIAVGRQADQALVMRFAPDGTPRTTFGTSGSVLTGGNGSKDELHRVAIQPNGKIVAVGTHRIPGGDTDGLVVRLLPDGTLDPSFGTGGVVHIDVSAHDELDALVLEPGGYVMAGTAEAADGVSRPWLVRLH